MKAQKSKQKKFEYERIVKIAKEAQKEAEKFIRKNIRDNSQIQLTYSR